MMSLPGIINSDVKNRVEESLLNAELGRLEREKQDEMRMSNNEKQRFVVKYSKHILSSQDPEVKMYETTPGFCFRRNGEHRLPQDSPRTQNIDFKDLHFLLFTNGEVDIDKLVCLNLLSFHDPEDVWATKVLKTITHSILKKDSPLEQLIERSEGASNDLNTFSHLPCFVLDVQYSAKEKKVRDSRLNNRLLINERLLNLIETVLTTLEYSNVEKIKKLMEIASDTSMIKRIFVKPHIQDFLLDLKNSPLLHSRGSFVLSGTLEIRPPHLELKTSSGTLEDLLNSIRANVLQLNKNFSENLINLEGESKEALDNEVEIKNSSNRSSAKKVRTRRDSNESTNTIFEPKDNESFESYDISRFRRQSTNFIAKNITAIGTWNNRVIKKKSHDRPRSSQKSLAKFRPIREQTSSERLERESKEERKRGEFCTNPEHVRVHLKQTTCAACMERWRVPLPTPKVATIVRRSNDSISISSNLHQRLSQLIEQEEYKLNSFERKFSPEEASHQSLVSSASNRRSSQSFKANKHNEIIDFNLNIYDLERIKQEIREKEARKKFEKFIND